MASSDVVVAPSGVDGPDAMHTLIGMDRIALLGCLALACHSAAASESARDPRSARAEAKASGPVPTLAPTAADVELAEAVRQRLANHPSLTPEGIDVSAANGVVTLSGQADSDFERQEAELATVWVDGVKRVDNELAVSARLISDRDDATLAADLSAAFADDPRIDAALVSVEVEGGVVTLTGTLPDWDMVDAVLERTFARLPRAVVNHLERRDRPQRPSEN